MLFPGYMLQALAAAGSTGLYRLLDRTGGFGAALGKEFRIAALLVAFCICGIFFSRLLIDVEAHI